MSLSVLPGERVALLGGNGAGKSTLFLCASGVLAPTGGEIFLGGRKLGRGREDLRLLRRSVGMVFQDPDDQLLAPTVEGEVSFGPMNLRLPEGEISTRCSAALESMNLLEHRLRPPHYLSGGEKKRVSIADILAMAPQLILLDEPTASLDDAHTALLWETLERLHQSGLALMISTHDVAFAWQWAERAVVLCDGQIIADASTGRIFSQPAVLQRAGLKRPVLFELGQMLFPKTNVDNLPRDMPAFKKMWEEKEA